MNERPRSPAARAPQRHPRAGQIRGYLATRVDPLTSLFLVIPLFVIYHLGVLIQVDCNANGCAWVGNGVDYITGTIMRATHGSRLAYALITLGVAAALGVGVMWSRRHAKLHPRMLGPVLLESAIYASLVSPIINLMRNALTLGAPGSSTYFGDLIASCGAGLHEELIFRAGLFAGGTWALTRLKVKPLHALLIAGAVSSVLFSAVHHMGSLGEAFTFSAFFFRILAGALFATIYHTRGFAIAAWTHCLYDVWVFTLQRA